MIELKFKVGDVLVPTDFRGYGTIITVLEVNPSDKVNAYRTSDQSDYWWHKDTIERYYELSGEKQPPKFKVGDKLKVDNPDRYPDWNKESLNVEVLDVNPNNENMMYRTSYFPVYFWCRRIIEDHYYLVDEPKEEIVAIEHKFNVGDIIGHSDTDRFRCLIREIDNEGYYVVSRYNTDMLYPDDNRITLTPAYIHRHYQLVGQGDDFNILLENARKARKAVNNAKLEYLKYQAEYECAMDAFDKAQLAVNKYVQSKINNGLDD